jgi:hypothetical protein
MYGTLDEAIRACVRYERVFDPDGDENVRNTYRNAYTTWRAIYPHMLRLVEMGLTRPMWKAAGA